MAQIFSRESSFWQYKDYHHHHLFDNVKHIQQQVQNCNSGRTTRQRAALTVALKYGLKPNCKTNYAGIHRGSLKRRHQATGRAPCARATGACWSFRCVCKKNSRIIGRRSDDLADVVLCVRSGLVNQTSLKLERLLIAPKRLKLRTSNLTSVFPGTVGREHLKNFLEKGAWLVSRGPLNFWV